MFLVYENKNTEYRHLLLNPNMYNQHSPQSSKTKGNHTPTSDVLICLLDLKFAKNFLCHWFFFCFFQIEQEVPAVPLATGPKKQKSEMWSLLGKHPVSVKSNNPESGKKIPNLESRRKRQKSSWLKIREFSLIFVSHSFDHKLCSKEKTTAGNDEIVRLQQD